MTRWIIAIALGAWLALVMLGAGARWLGQQTASHSVPLPDRDGCWLAICFFDLTADDIPVALNAHPGVVTGSAERLHDAALASDNRYRFVYAPGGLRPQPIALVWDETSYYLAPGQSPGGAPPWMRLGDVIAALGAPGRVTLLTDQIGLHYPAENLVIFVARGYGLPRLSPRDAVIGVSVLRRGLPDGGERVYYPPSSAWRGFGWYLLDE